MARGDTNFTSETARIAAGRPKSRSLAPLWGVLPFLRPYRGRILVAVLALVASSTATLVLPLFLRGLINAEPQGFRERRALGRVQFERSRQQLFLGERHDNSLLRSALPDQLI